MKEFSPFFKRIAIVLEKQDNETFGFEIQVSIPCYD